MKAFKHINHTMRLAAPVCVVLCVSCNLKSNHSTPATSADREAIEKVITETVEAANNGDFESVLSNFADDAVLLIPEQVPIFGKKLIRPRFQELFDHSQIKLFFTLEEAVPSGASAFARGYASGTVEPTDNNGSMRIFDYHECLAILLKDSTGSWKIARLMWGPMYPPQKIYTKTD